MSTYKVFISRSINQDVDYIVEANSVEEAEEIAANMCTNDIHSGTVVREDLNELGWSVDCPTKLIR